MKRLLSSAAVLAVAMTLAVPPAAFAQTTPSVTSPATPAAAAPGAPRRHGSRYMRALRALNLSDAQRQQIRTIVRNQQQTLQTQIDDVLTPAQRAQLRSSMQGTPQAKPSGT